MKNHYQILGISENADINEIREAHCKKCKIFHPHKHNNDGEETRIEFERILSEVNEAYSVLIDKEKREQYDAQLREQRLDAERLRENLTKTQNDLAEAKEEARKVTEELNDAYKKNAELEDSCLKTQNELSVSESRLQRKRHKSIIIWVISSIIAITIVLISIISMRSELSTYIEERPVAVQDTINIEGIYRLRKITVNQDIEVSTVEITTAQEGYTMTVYSDYAPCSIHCSMTSDGIFHSDLWGDGLITYRPSDGTIHIKYELNETTLCELSK